MTTIQNGVWLKTNYRVYLRCLEFLSAFNYPTFFLGASASEESITVAEIACSTSQIKMATLKEALSVGDLRCLGVSRNFSCLGRIRRFSELEDIFSVADRRF